MRIQNIHERGIGVLVAVAIIAFVGIGGVAAVQMYQNTQTNLSVNEGAMSEETREDIHDAKENAESELLRIRADIEADAYTSVSAILETLADVKQELSEAYVEADVETRTELRRLENSIQGLETEISARSGSASRTLDEIIASLRVSINESIEVDNGTEATVDLNTEVEGNASTSSEVNGQINAGTGGLMEL